MAKHTPGPYEVDKENPQLVAKLVDGVYEYLANCDPSDFSSTQLSQEEIEANARLFALAPEMLDKLKQAYYTLRYMRGTAGLVASILYDTIQKAEKEKDDESQ